MENKYQSAFPNKRNVENIGSFQLGLTKLEYASIELMKAMVSSPELLQVVTAQEVFGNSAKEKCASKAIEWSKELLKQLEENKTT